MGFMSALEYFSWCKENKEEKKKLGLPSEPDKRYCGEFESWYEYLGTSKRRKAKTT